MSKKQCMKEFIETPYGSIRSINSELMLKSIKKQEKSIEQLENKNQLKTNFMKREKHFQVGDYVYYVGIPYNEDKDLQEPCLGKIEKIHKPKAHTCALYLLNKQIPIPSRSDKIIPIIITDTLLKKIGFNDIVTNNCNCIKYVLEDISLTWAQICYRRNDGSFIFGESGYCPVDFIEALCDGTYINLEKYDHDIAKFQKDYHCLFYATDLFNLLIDKGVKMDIEKILFDYQEEFLNDSLIQGLIDNLRR